MVRPVQIVLFANLLVLMTVMVSAAQERPNVVLMFADDLGYGDLACYGHPYAKTPAIDQLAKDGTRFTQFYVTGVTCNPSRTGLMTGLHPARFPKYAADFGFGKRTTITELLHQSGYQVGHFGKWHIGPQATNGTYGIDVVKTIGKSRDKSLGRDDDLYSAAIDFIRENKDQRFYVNIWGHGTHFPVNSPDRLVANFGSLKVNPSDFSTTMRGKFDTCLKIGGELNGCMRQYLADVYQIDQNVDRVLKTLDELGLRENTIVVFSSDHGPAPVLTKKGARKYSENMLGYAGEFQGGKHSQYEGGVRVPFIIRWPGEVPAGKVNKESVCSFVDWLPTVGKLAGIETLPTELDGEDVSSIWQGTHRTRKKPLFWKTSAPGSTSAMRDGKWKIHVPRPRRGKVELYDLSKDPGESNNLADSHPKVVERLKQKVAKWAIELPDSYTKLANKKREE